MSTSRRVYPARRSTVDRRKPRIALKPLEPRVHMSRAEREAASQRRKAMSA